MAWQWTLDYIAFKRPDSRGSPGSSAAIRQRQRKPPLNICHQSSSASNTTATVQPEPVRFATASTSEPVQSPATDTVQDGSSLTPQVTPEEAIAPVETSPVDGLKISSQSWRRGGLGSKALVTLTLRNANEYAVKDIEIFCSFARRDGSHLTDRKRVIHDTVSMRSQKTFARMHVGFVNVNANQAKCSLVAASPV